MPSGSKVLSRPGNTQASGGGIAPGRRIWQAVFWSPSYFLTGIVHILCQPLTKKYLLGAVVLDIPLQWGTHLAIGPDASTMGALEGFDISITTIALIGLYIGWLFTERVEGRQVFTLWNWPIVAYTTVVVASVFVAGDVQLSMFQIFLMLEMLLVYLYVAGNVTSRDDIVFVLYLLILGGLIESTYMLVLDAVGHDFAFVRTLGFKTVVTQSNIPGEAMRFGGTIGPANYAAAYLAILITLALAIRQMRVSAYLRRLTVPLIVLAAAALVITLSRGGWLEVIFSVAIVMIAKWLRNGASLKGIVIGVIVATTVALCLYAPNPISERLSANDNGSAYSRIPLMHLADNIIKANPVLGVGANNFTAVMDDYEGPEFRHAWLYTVHNEFLLVCSETGVIGLIAYVWIYFDIVRRGWRLWRRRDAMFAPLGLGICAAVCGLMSHMMVDIFSDRGLIQLVWILAAMIAACEMIVQNKATVKGAPLTSTGDM